MKSLSGVGLGLSLVFGCLLVALLGELYYLLWWKKKSIAKRRRRRNNSNINGNGDEEGCWKNPSSTICSLRCTAQDLCSSSSSVHEPQSSMELWLKPFRDGENLPRFLFTITEETREDLESSEDGGNIVSRSNLNDLLQILETPYLTPIGSPHYFTPPITPSSFSNTTYDNRLINSPFSESERDAAFNRLMSSPPPKFKFLRDAEEKLIVNQRRKNMEETGNRERKINDDSSDSVVCKEEENGPFITIIVAKSQEDEKEEQLNNVR
ncbi:hypothetical protein ABFS82_06G146300 [Erythranthe guttata]|uniref:uncharacterized protein LOC105962692 n=1 Tax=Erythranthe guttata TaxID=4155 RepID=UPI00064DDEC6|nr:PREDICTED: uncharacterized protein LOC105962692 [Erythranthe guttata]|eukprot:XP_012842461.1 PREDICTED: uncharacterized protein LOC105962692 [Erythranthe guttata]